jgi:hypothetical protein
MRANLRDHQDVSDWLPKRETVNINKIKSMYMLNMAETLSF